MKAKSFFWNGLAFFVLFVSCKYETTIPPITINWNLHQAIGLTIPLSIISTDFNEIDIPGLRIIRSGNTTSILGEFKVEKNVLVFNPMIPLTPGLEYQVYFKDKLVGQILIPPASTPDPAVFNIFPIQDTLPQNLLKFYIRFSNPMQGGEVLHYIKLIKNNTDTLSDVFLDLQNELWNEDQTLLTLWLNPGRIKRGLQPNLNQGPPLLKGNQYQLLILGDWQDIHGKNLGTSVIKNFYATERDTISPQIDHMKIVGVASDSKQDVIEVRFAEALDHELLFQTISIVDDANKDITEWIKPNDAGTSILFKIKKTSASKTYRLKMEARQEDLCGNNLNRLFDMDNNKPSNTEHVFYKNLVFSNN